MSITKRYGISSGFLKDEAGAFYGQLETIARSKGFRWGGRFRSHMFRSPFSPAAAQNKSDSGYMKGPQTADTWGQLSDANFPKVGHIVQLRTRTYLVDDVIRSPEIVFGTWSDLFALMMMPRASRWRSSGNSSSRKRLSTARHWKSIANKEFDSPKFFGAYVRTLRWNCVTVTNPRLFQSPFRAVFVSTPISSSPCAKPCFSPESIFSSLTTSVWGRPSRRG